MRVLLVGIESLLADRLDALLGGSHDIARFTGDELDIPELRAAAAGAEAVLLSAPVREHDEAAEAILRASAPVYHTVMAIPEAARVILLSSLRPFERYPASAQVTEYWAPRPTTDQRDLVPFVAETVVREVVHERRISAICLRTGEIVSGGAPDRRAVHVDDVAQAVRLALDFEPDSQDGTTGWWVFHIVGAGDTRFPLGLAARRAPYPNGGRGSALGYQPKHDLASGAAYDAGSTAEVTTIAQRVARSDSRRRRLVVFGAGGPFGAAAAERLASDTVLRLTDARPYDQIVDAATPQSAGAPMPIRYSAPHETAVVDVTDPAQVAEALRGMDVALNLTVVRDHPIASFQVNTVGAYNVMHAALVAGVARVIFTGPNQVFNPAPGAYWSDFHLGSDVPQRPGAHPYMLSKFVGQEIARVFAQEQGIAVLTLVFGYFADPATADPDPLGGHPFTVSWRDTGEAMARAVRAVSFPRPYEVVHVQGDLPHGKYRNDRIKDVLGWQPGDDLGVLWARQDSGWSSPPATP